MTLENSIEEWKRHINKSNLSPQQKKTNKTKARETIQGWNCTEDEAYDKVKEVIDKGGIKLPFTYIGTPQQKSSPKKASVEGVVIDKDWQEAVDLWQSHLSAIKSVGWAEDRIIADYDKMRSLWRSPQRALMDIEIITNMTTPEGGSFMGLFVPDKKKKVDRSKLENYGYSAPVYDEVKGYGNSILDDYFDEFEKEGGDE